MRKVNVGVIGCGGRGRKYSRLSAHIPELNMRAYVDIKEEVAKLVKIQDSKIEPVAFGLKALKIFFVLDESKGNIDSLEEKIKEIEGVGNVEVVDMRRAIG